jgi:hypothetical protein
MIEQLLLHGVGDYITQSSWMGLTKKKPGTTGFLACLIHCLLYSAPFALIASWPAVAVIFSTHFIIDRYKLVDWFIALRDMTFHTRNFGFPESRPALISVWLYIITDNVFHLLCNYCAIRWL